MEERVGAGERILVVDDEWSILELLKFRFKRRGYEVFTAHDSDEFVEQAFRVKPDVIILDIWLRNRLGTEVYDELLRLGFDSDTPVIFITALVDQQTSNHVSPRGKFAFYSKPFDFEDLLLDVKRLLEMRRKPQEET